MSDVMRFVKGLKKQIASNTHVAMLATIVKFDPQSMKADIQPVQKGLPMIVDVPVALQKAGPFFIRVPYEPGDTVVVVFSDFALDGSSSAEHRIDDAIIVGGIAGSGLTGEHGKDLLIMHKQGKAKIVISETGDIEMIANGNFSIKTDGAFVIDADAVAITAETLGATIDKGAGITRFPDDDDNDPEDVVWE